MIDQSRRNLILGLIYLYNGKLDGYRLRKITDRQGFNGRLDFGKDLDDFLEEGLIERVASGTSTARAFKVTPIGEEIARSLLEEKGIEYFRDPLNNSNDFNDLMS